jgi:hypothetical protein
MKMSVGERVVLFERLPREGTVTTLRTLQALRTAISLSPAEMKRLRIVQRELRHPVTGVVSMFLEIPTESSISEIEIPMSGEARAIVVGVLRALNDRSQLPENMLSLWEKFVEAPADSPPGTGKKR